MQFYDSYFENALTKSPIQMINTRTRELIEQGYTIVAANKRLARYLAFHYAKFRIQAGDTAWESADILSWQGWLSRCRDEVEFARQTGQQLLNTYQRRCLWENIVRNSVDADRLLQVSSIINQAVYSYETCKSWNIPVFPEQIYLNEDARAFRSWYMAYEAECRRNGWIDDISLPDMLAEALSDTAPLKIALYGFDELTPQQCGLVNRLRMNGHEVVEVLPEQINRHVRYGMFENNIREVIHAAHWARDILGKDPQATIGIVFPDLARRRQTISRVLDETLDPGSLVRSQVDNDKPYVIALGRPLTDYPLVHTALQVISLGRPFHTTNELGELIRSPFIKDAETERSSRARCEARLRQSREYQWTLKTLLASVSGFEPQDRADGFITLLKEFEIAFLSCARRQGTRDWAETFAHWLAVFGWPGNRKLDSAEFQTFNEWQQALTRLASLDRITAACSYIEALSHLRRILAGISFQPETAEAPIQVMGVNGVAGMQFDHLWLGGLHDRVWPVPCEPDPFIPLPLQRDAGLPRASAGLQLEVTRRMTARLVESATEVVVAWPGFEDERQCRPSPMLETYIAADKRIELTEVDDYKTRILLSARLETFADPYGPVIPADELARGGAGIFRDQAACPFRSFARYRLFAEGLVETDIGMNPQDRGSLVHRVMQYLWQRLKSQEALHQRSAHELDKLLRAVVDEAVRQQSLRQPGTFNKRFIELERARLIKLLNEWLQVERDRVPFRVAATEHLQTMLINGLECRLRIDRIDEMTDGRKAIIDYKTGTVKIADWEGERPNDPQLPLYAVASESELAAVAYAHLKRGQSRFIGIAATEDILPDVKVELHEDNGQSGWQSRIAGWRVVLEKLAGEFRAGRAMVDPKDTQSCRYCDLHSLCRIHELAQLETEQVDED